MWRSPFLSILGGLTTFVATIVVLISTEPTSARLGFSLAVTVTLAAALALLSRRLLFASVVTFCFVASVLAVSRAKLAAMNMAFHSYDLAFYSSIQTIAFLWEEYRPYVVWTGVAGMAILTLATLAWCLDRTRCSRLVAACVLTVAVFAATQLAPRERANARAYKLLGETHSLVSSFYLSWGETYRALQGEQLLNAASATGLPDFRPMSRCEPSGKPPHILLIHQESLVPPSLFSGLDYDRSLDTHFLSDDQQLHKLGVETYGGASWITEFALLSGVTTKDFGGMAPFAQVYMRGRLKETLPQALKSCGYRSILLFPMDEGFLSLDGFYRSIGFSEILDRQAQGAQSAQERDRFYFQNALNAMERQFISSKEPLFLYVQTMAAHGPYEEKYLPAERVPAGGPGTSAQMNEYLRRMAMAKRDGDFLVSEIERRFPGEPILIVRYGDHQPTATRELLAQAQKDQKAGVLKGPAPDPYVTYYAMTGSHFVVPPLPSYQILDVAYLGTVLLEAAGLPLSESQQERKRLMIECHGRYAGCKHRLVFNRRLINSGLVQSP